MSWPLPSDMAEHRMMERGSYELQKAILLALAGKDPRTRANLIWSMTEGGWNTVPGSRSSAHLYGEPRTFEKDRHAESLKTLRDPCPKCGTRMDIGCAHVKHIFTANQVLTDTAHVDRAWDRAIREGRQQAGDDDLEAFR